MDEVQHLIAELASGDDERAEAAVARLAGYGPAVLHALQELLSANAGSSPEERDARWWGVRALAEITGPQVVPLLIYYLGDEDPGLRQCAALGLRKQPDPQAVQALVSALEDKDHLVASLAADALAAIGAASVPALLEVLHDGSPGARVEAARALANIGDHRSIQALFDALDDGSALVQHWANEGLERMGVGMTFFKP